MSTYPRDELDSAGDAQWLTRERRLFALRAELVDDEPLPPLNLPELRAVEARAGGALESGSSVARRAGWAGAGLAAAALLGVLANSGSPPPSEAPTVGTSAPPRASAPPPGAYEEAVCILDDDSTVISSSKDGAERSDAGSETAACTVQAAHAVPDAASERTCSEEIDAPICGSL